MIVHRIKANIDQAIRTEGLVTVEAAELGLMVPLRWCSTCKRSPSKICAAIPIAVDPLYRSRFDYLGRPTSILADLKIRVMADAADRGDWEHPVWRDNRPFGALSVEDFRDLEPVFRKMLSWSSPRLLLPGARVGPLTIVAKRKPVPDIFSTTDSLIASQAFKDAFEHDSLSGVEWYPVELQGASCRDRFYELVVTGYVDVNGKQAPDFQICPECQEPWLPGGADRVDWPLYSAVGFDVFHLPARGTVYLTERAAKLVMSPAFDCAISLVPVNPSSRS